MSRSKEQYFRSLWIDVEKRRPPNNDDRVLCWNGEWESVREVSGRILNIQLDQVQDNPVMAERIRADKFVKELDTYFATHWMPRWGPKRGKKRKGVLHCSVCGLEQYSTPSGMTCSNGHGGEDAMEDL